MSTIYICLYIIFLGKLDTSSFPSPLRFVQTPLKVWTMYGPMAKWIWLYVPVNHKVASRDYSNESCDRPKMGGRGWWLFLGWCKKCVFFGIYLRWVVELGQMETWSPTSDSIVGCIKTCCKIMGFNYVYLNLGSYLAGFIWSINCTSQGNGGGWCEAGGL